MNSTLKPIVVGGTLCAVLDFIAATTLYVMRGNKPIRLWQAVASGMLGPASFQQGWFSAALGVMVHVLVSFTATTVFFVASRQFPVLRERYLISGPLYGLVIYAFMNLVVIPLSAIGKTHPPTSAVVAQLLVHALIIGPSISFSIYRFSS